MWGYSLYNPNSGIPSSMKTLTDYTCKDGSFSLKFGFDTYTDDEIESHILYKFKEEKPFTITKEDDVYVIHSDRIEKLFKMTKFTDEGVRRFSNKLRRMGVDEELQKLGIEEGDLVRIDNFEFEYTLED